LNEALTVDWYNIDVKRGEMEIWREKTSEPSVVPISDRLGVILKRLANQKRPFMEMTRGVRPLRVIVGQVCNQNDRLNTQRGKATLHSLRDTYATRLVTRGMTLHKVAKLLGHKSTVMSQKYAHLEGREVTAEARMILNARV
jgi:integrase